MILSIIILLGKKSIFYIMIQYKNLYFTKINVHVTNNKFQIKKKLNPYIIYMILKIYYIINLERCDTKNI